MYNDAGNVFVRRDHFGNAIASENGGQESKSSRNMKMCRDEFWNYSANLSMSLISCEMESEDEFSRGLRINEESWYRV